MQELLLCLASNALHGFALVRLLAEDLLSPVTMSDNNHLESVDFIRAIYS